MVASGFGPLEGLSAGFFEAGAFGDVSPCLSVLVVDGEVVADGLQECGEGVESGGVHVAACFILMLGPEMS